MTTKNTKEVPHRIRLEMGEKAVAVLERWKRACANFEPLDEDQGMALVVEIREELVRQWEELHQALDAAKTERNYLADAALVILSANGICTPEKGYVAEPYMLALDVKELARQRDKARSEKASLELEAADFRKCVAGFIGSTVRLVEELYKHDKSYEWIKEKLLSHPSLLEVKELYKKWPERMALPAARNGEEGA